MFKPSLVIAFLVGMALALPMPPLISATTPI
jgi:hypothetical protein